jgi:hypothetical protein
MFQHPKVLLIICVQDKAQASHIDGINNIFLSPLSVNSWEIKY